jgi:hypothetical protein
MLMRRGRISDFEESILAAAAVSVLLGDEESTLAAASVGLEAVLDANDDMDAGDSGRGGSAFTPSQGPGVEPATLLVVTEESDDEAEAVDGVESRVGRSARSGLSSGAVPAAFGSGVVASSFSSGAAASGFCAAAAGLSFAFCFSWPAMSDLATAGG